MDTLESPSMEAKTVGYAALRLCVDSNNQQPTSLGGNSAFTSDCFLNAGHYLLPIYYGRVPDGVLSQALIETMTPLEGAYLNVRLFDAAAEEKNKHNNVGTAKPMPQSPNTTPLPTTTGHCGVWGSDYDLKLSRRSVAQMVVGTVARLVPCELKSKFPLSKAMLEDLYHNRPLDRGVYRLKFFCWY